MLMRSKRRTHSQIGGNELGDTWLNAGGRPLGAESTAGVAGGVPTPAQEVSTNKKTNPNKWVSTDFIYTFLYHSIVHLRSIVLDKQIVLIPLLGGVFTLLLKG